MHTKPKQTPSLHNLTLSSYTIEYFDGLIGANFDAILYACLRTNWITLITNRKMEFSSFHWCY